ncbi:MAG: DUF7718 family protein [Dehalococcoidia bacterium]
MGETSFVAFLTSDDRIRHYHFSIKGKITEFTVQYEAFINGSGNTTSLVLVDESDPSLVPSVTQCIS